MEETKAGAQTQDRPLTFSENFGVSHERQLELNRALLTNYVNDTTPDGRDRINVLNKTLLECKTENEKYMLFSFEGWLCGKLRTFGFDIKYLFVRMGIDEATSETMYNKLTDEA